MVPGASHECRAEAAPSLALSVCLCPFGAAVRIPFKAVPAMPSVFVE